MVKWNKIHRVRTFFDLSHMAQCVLWRRNNVWKDSKFKFVIATCTALGKSVMKMSRYKNKCHLYKSLTLKTAMHLFMHLINILDTEKPIFTACYSITAVSFHKFICFVLYVVQWEQTEQRQKVSVSSCCGGGVELSSWRMLTLSKLTLMHVRLDRDDMLSADITFDVFKVAWTRRWDSAAAVLIVFR